MIHKAQSLKDFERTVSHSLEISGKKNRFCTIGSTVEKITDIGTIYKISIAQFQSGSDYVTRKKSREGEDFTLKRKSYYSDYNENGTVRFLNRDPSKKYICVWKSQIKSLEEYYTDDKGEVIKKESISGLKEGEPDAPRYYHMENVWYVSANGQQIYGDDYDLYKDFLNNI
jgi:dipeptidyl aminopeptidase/acylaminoacyl peptidase